MSFRQDVRELRAAMKANIEAGHGSQSLARALRDGSDRSSDEPRANGPAQQTPALPPTNPTPAGTSMAKWGWMIGLAVIAAVSFAAWSGSSGRKGVGQSAITLDSPVSPTDAPQTGADAYVERVQAYWLPEARSLPTELPADEAQIGTLLTKIDGLVVNVRDGASLDLEGDQEHARAQLASTLAERQQTLLPAMRKQYGLALDAKLSHRGIRVASSGGRSTTIRFTGSLFSMNANAEAMQAEMEPVVKRLRFTKVEYRWSSQYRDGPRYDLDVPSDNQLAFWGSAGFERVTFARDRKSRDPACVPHLAKSVGLGC